MRYHINKHGVPAVCKAQPGNCPLGGNDNHFNTKKDANNFIQQQNMKQHGLLPQVNKKDVKPYRLAKTEKDLSFIEYQKRWLQKECEDMTYIERCRSAKKLNDYIPSEAKTNHFKTSRKSREKGLYKTFGKGELIGYYEVDHIVGNLKHNDYKKQVTELRDNGIMVIYDIDTGRKITTFLPHRARTEAMMLLAGEIPNKNFLKKISENKKIARKLRLDN